LFRFCEDLQRAAGANGFLLRLSIAPEQEKKKLSRKDLVAVKGIFIYSFSLFLCNGEVR
jgi:hypothetical protein